MGRIKNHPSVNPALSYNAVSLRSRKGGVKLIVGFIFKEENILKKAEFFLKRRFGKIDFESQTSPFTHTDYYQDEFGKCLKRKFISFEKLVPPGTLSQIKIITNRIEQKLSLNNKRKMEPTRAISLKGSYGRNTQAATTHPRPKGCGFGPRSINIDPGYLDLARLVLASTKDYKHRIYLNKGIYAEVTLFYQDRTFQPWQWTYPDYKTPEYIAIFNKIRDILILQIKGN